MGSPRKPWSKAQIRRVIDSIHAGGYAAYRSRQGWNIWLSGPGAGPSRRRYFIPEASLASRSPRWLGNRLVTAVRESLDELEGVRLVSGAEAQRLVRWCVRSEPRRPRPPLTAKQRARRAEIARIDALTWRVPETVHGVGYTAERSRRGWVVRLRSYSGRLPGHYLVPFRALDSRGRKWSGVHLVAALKRSLSKIDGVQLTNDTKVVAPTGWPRAA
jgi:hypothetical protein